jgi:hypothetical protein
LPSNSLQTCVQNGVRRHGRRALLTVVGLSWLLVIAVGVGVLWSFENTAGLAAAAPGQWPSASQLPAPRGRFSLVVLLHPQCACSRATVAELARLMTKVRGTVDVNVLVLADDAIGDGWSRSDLWDAAAAIPGVNIFADEGGTEARHFGTATSGEAILYDAAGRLQFSGGITRSRGHEGENAGRSALESILRDGMALRSSTSVFGCPLFAETRRTAVGIPVL